MHIVKQSLPRIIQGGMGVGVSDYRLARAVSLAGGLGIVSGTAIGHVLARRLEDGDEHGDMRRALSHLPIPSLAEHVLKKYFTAKRKSSAGRFSNIPLFAPKPHFDLVALYIAANFCEVWLAKEGHNHMVGINYLEKIQLPHLCSFYGALLAGVDCITMGAGVPIQVPEALALLSKGRGASYRLHVEQATKTHVNEFDPREFDPESEKRAFARPLFFPIIATASLAEILIKKSHGAIDGFIVEGPTAGGHNAPPRGVLRLNEHNEPIYGEKDIVDLERMRRTGLPFWLAGSHATPQKYQEAIRAGAHGIQAGTIFALADESGIDNNWKDALRKSACDGTLCIFTDARASSSGFPFKVAQVSGTMSEASVYGERIRLCDLGFLRTLYETPKGEVGFRCPGEPMNIYERKGGQSEDAIGRKCLCNALIANIGLGQMRRDGYTEPPIFTLGDDMSFVETLCSGKNVSYKACDAIRYLTGEVV